MPDEDKPARPIQFNIAGTECVPETRPVSGSTSANRYLDELKAKAEEAK